MVKAAMFCSSLCQCSTGLAANGHSPSAPGCSSSQLILFLSLGTFHFKRFYPPPQSKHLGFGAPPTSLAKPHPCWHPFQGGRQSPPWLPWMFLLGKDKTTMQVINSRFCRLRTILLPPCRMTDSRDKTVGLSCIVEMPRGVEREGKGSERSETPYGNSPVLVMKETLWPCQSQLLPKSTTEGGIKETTTKKPHWTQAHHPLPFFCVPLSHTVYCKRPIPFYLAACNISVNNLFPSDVLLLHSAHSLYPVLICFYSWRYLESNQLLMSTGFYHRCGRAEWRCPMSRRAELVTSQSCL